MSLLHILSYGAIVAAFAFVTLSLASGLLYISELIEEHSRASMKFGERGIYVIIVLHILLYLFPPNLPLKHILFSIFCHIIYLRNFSPRWPLIVLTSWHFISSCVLVLADHFLWFFFFEKWTHEWRASGSGTRKKWNASPTVKEPPGFLDIATFFAVCVWLAPLFLFLSLSANDNALPVSAAVDGEVSRSFSSRTSLFTSLLSSLPSLRLRRNRSRVQEGIIAPHSPLPPPRQLTSPLPSPRRSFTDSEFEVSNIHLSPRGGGVALSSMVTPPRRVSIGARPPEPRRDRSGSTLGPGMNGTILRRSSSSVNVSGLG